MLWRRWAIIIGLKIAEILTSTLLNGNSAIASTKSAIISIKLNIWLLLLRLVYDKFSILLSKTIFQLGNFPSITLCQILCFLFWFHIPMFFLLFYLKTTCYLNWLRAAFIITVKDYFFVFLFHLFKLLFKCFYPIALELEHYS